MNAIKYQKEKRRMTKGCSSSSCDDCLLHPKNNKKGILCTRFEQQYPEKAVAIVENWAKEHPVKTYKSVFLEKFPDAKIEKNGVPYPCIIYFFGEKVRPGACGNCSCTYCWDREVEE